ncbi:glycoside hydrolase family 3 C-terminal domain-containing protein [Flavitalea antarctica]
MRVKAGVFFLSILLHVSLSAQQVVPYKNASLPIHERVIDLLKRMTAQEKFWQLFMIPGQVDSSNESKFTNGIFGFQFSAESGGTLNTTQILKYNTSESALSLLKKINSTQRYFVEKTRLGIPVIAFDEALHGVVRDGGTAFPQAIGLAASFNTGLMTEVASAIATEAKARGIRQILSPVVNIANDVRWGRVEETYGEDPMLSAEMGVAFVKAFESKNIITTPKHFLANSGDGGRDSYPIHFNERLLEETYLVPFKACIERGGSRSIMTSYNSLDGSPASANNWLLNQKLKKDWKFRGFVISDAGAVGGANVLHYTTKDYPSSGAESVKNGLDVIFQTNEEHHKLFDPHFLDGSVDPAIIDSAVGRVLRAKFELGLFENPYLPETEAQQLLANTNHKAIANKAALESIVLLKNEKNILPLNRSVRSIALIGTDATEARLGGYSGPGNNKVSILEGLKQKLGKGTVINYAPGPGIHNIEPVPVADSFLSHTTGQGSIQKGLKAIYFDNVSLEGKPVLERVDQVVNFKWTFMAPAENIRTDNYSVRWTGNITFPRTGNYQLGLEGNDGFRLYINNKLVIDNWHKYGYHTRTVRYSFEKDKPASIKIEFYEPVANGTIRLVTDYGTPQNETQLINAATELAKKSDVAVIVAGIHEGEFQDRAFLDLPGKQELLIRQVAATGKPVVVVLVGGSAITMSSWIDKVPGIIDVWYPGEEGGHAIAAVLFGDYNPAGRLPITFPAAVGQVPLVYNHKPTGRGDDYYDLTGLPLFPFGFGLSYTKFEYSNLQLSRNNITGTDSTKVSFTLKNTGSRAGDEVVQLYIRDELASLARPVMELKGFQRIYLKPGENKTISFNVGPEALSMLDINLKRIVEPGEFRIMLGASSRDIRLKTTLVVK